MPITITHQQMKEYQAGQNEEVDLQRAIAESKEEVNNIPFIHENYGDYTIINKQNNEPYPNEEYEPPVVAYPIVEDYGPYPNLENKQQQQYIPPQVKETNPSFVDINQI